jgi:dTDP-glucose 4,6-dehydratase
LAVEANRREQQRILITGGCGFIGSALVRWLFRNSLHELMILDKLTYAAYPGAIEKAQWSDRVKLIQADIGDTDTVAEAMEAFRPQVILHLAAETHVDRSIDNPLRFVETNILGTARFLEVVRRYWQRRGSQESTFRFVQVSTDEVYGALGSEGSFEESSPYLPNSPYAASKASADHLVRAWWKTYGLPVIFSHCCNNYGPYQFPEKLIPLMIWKGMVGEDLPVYGSGQQVREWLYVDDSAEALARIAMDGEVGAIYHVSSHQSMSNLELVEMLAAQLEQVLPGCTKGAIKARVVHVADRPGHDFRYAMSSTRVTEQLGWNPKVAIQEGLEKTVRWYCEHVDFYQHCRSLGYNAERVGIHAASSKS